MLTRAVMILALLVVLFAVALVSCTEWLGRQAALNHPPKGTFLALPSGQIHYLERRPATEARGTVVLVHGASSAHAE